MDSKLRQTLLDAGYKNPHVVEIEYFQKLDKLKDLVRELGKVPNFKELARALLIDSKLLPKKGHIVHAPAETKVSAAVVKRPCLPNQEHDFVDLVCNNCGLEV